MFSFQSKTPSTLLGASLIIAALAAPHALRGQDTFAVSGTVVDQTTGEPLQYSVVGIPGQQSWDLTDENGVFELTEIEAGPYRFMVLRRGYYYADQNVNFAGPMNIQVDMSPEEENNPVGPGEVIGQIRDQESGRPIEGVTVELVPANQTVETDGQGNFRFQDVSTGAVLLRSRRVGYQPREDTTAAFPGITVDVKLTLAAAAIPLDPIVVVARSPFLAARGFYRRGESSNGFQAGRQEIEETTFNDLLPLFRRVSGVRMQRDRFGTPVLTNSRSRDCVLLTFIDGMRTPGFDMGTMPPEHVEALEVYLGVSVPMEYDHSCGVVLIWTRRPGGEEFWNRAAR
jgi:hypothetical protein